MVFYRFKAESAESAEAHPQVPCACSLGVVPVVEMLSRKCVDPIRNTVLRDGRRIQALPDCKCAKPADTSGPKGLSKYLFMYIKKEEHIF